MRQMIVPNCSTGLSDRASDGGQRRRCKFGTIEIKDHQFQSTAIILILSILSARSLSLSLTALTHSKAADSTIDSTTPTARLTLVRGLGTSLKMREIVRKSSTLFINNLSPSQIQKIHCGHSILSNCVPDVDGSLVQTVAQRLTDSRQPIASSMSTKCASDDADADHQDNKGAAILGSSINKRHV